TGEYYDNGWVAETHFPFTVKLCLHPSAQSLTVSIDRFCLETETSSKRSDVVFPGTFDTYARGMGKGDYDAGTGFFNFDLSWENGKAIDNYKWDLWDEISVHLTLALGVTIAP
ncbi:MAG: hypothetical protein LBE83_09010, partial [Propionibacteriaceae bacterium]|nr:hypothetical protein [Propionibacteriaceae bacterium]